MRNNKIFLLVLNSFILIGSNIFAMDPLADRLGQLKLNESGSLIEPKLKLDPQICEIILNEEDSSFALIQYLANHKLEDFMSEVVRRNASLKNRCEATLCTSCINTVHALAIVFIGEEEAKMALRRLSDIPSGSFSITIPSYEKRKYNLSLLSGYVIDRIQQFGYDEFYSFPETNQHNIIDLYLNQTKDILFAEQAPKIKEIITNNKCIEMFDKIDRFFSKTYLNHNKMALEGLRRTILSNNPKTNVSRSFSYFVVIYSHNGGVEHAFILEQFYNAKQEQILFRVHQSCIIIATLAEDLRNNQKIWNMAELQRFLSALEKAYCAADPDEKINLYSCFGYNIRRGPLTEYENQKFNGLTFHYSAFAFDPKSCINNVQQFFNGCTEK